MKLKKLVTHICGWAKAKTSAKIWTDTDDTILHSFKEKKSTFDSFQSFHFERKRKFKCCGNAVELDGASTRAPFLDACDKFIDTDASAKGQERQASSKREPRLVALKPIRSFCLKKKSSRLAAIAPK
eukprot:g74728.t1